MTPRFVRALAVPKLGGKLPPRTAKLAVPPGSICMVPAQGPLFHSDRGVQYVADGFVLRVADVHEVAGIPVVDILPDVHGPLPSAVVDERSIMPKAGRSRSNGRMSVDARKTQFLKGSRGGLKGERSGRDDRI